MSADIQNAPEVQLAVDEIPLAQPFSILIFVCDETLVNKMRVDAIMPAHQHGMNYTPSVAALGDGVFRVNGMLFHMPGSWEIRLDVNFDGHLVSYTSDIVLK